MGHRTFSKLIVRVTIGALALAISAIILSVAILNGFKQEIIEKQRGFFGDVVITKNDLSASFENTPIELSPQTLAQLRALPQVIDITSLVTYAGIIIVNVEVDGVILKCVHKSYNFHYIPTNIIF